ncbi:MAG: hypothetical protein GX443_18900 [Deltaproteobacteria bacterium]|nr:hypothetical protein [Deltaproteobacteria bacterium]
MCCSRHTPVCHPWAWRHECCHYHPPAWFTGPAVQPYLCPLCGQPYHLCCCSIRPSIHVHQEVSADTANPSREAFIGGSRNVRLTIEYMPVTGATTPSVKVVVTDSSDSSEWNVTTIPAGYHVKEDFASAAPGSTVKLEVKECMARLRWCEALCC